MTDPFSTFAAVAGVAALTVQAIKSLTNDVQAIREAPAAVDNLKQDLDAVAGVIQLLEGGTGELRQHFSADANMVLASALENCKTACETFQAKLKRWMSHSHGQQIYWWDRVRVGILADKKVEMLSKQLLQCKITINTALGTMTLLTSLRLRPRTEETQTILLTQEDRLKEEVARTDQAITQISNDLTLMTTNGQSRGGEEPDEDAEQDQDLDAQRTSLRCTRDMLRTLISDIHSQRTEQRIRDIEMTEGGRLVVGQVNVQDRSGAITQDISNVRATKEGKGIVGVAEGLDINAFFK